MTSTSLGLSAPLGFGLLKAQYIRANQGGPVNADDAWLLGLGYQYDLSKRTALYATAARLSNRGAGRFVLSPPAAVRGGERSSGYEFGMRHSF
jgi:predicted porin